MPASGLNSDLHADADYRAHLIGSDGEARGGGGGLNRVKEAA